MEFLLELLMEIFVGGSLELAADKEVPRGLRIAALILSTLFYCAFIVLFFILMIEIENTFARVLLGGILLLAVFMPVKLWYKAIKQNKSI